MPRQPDYQQNASKCREWEKERRNRLNAGFETLCKLLPCYDPSANDSKITILQKATTYIEELQGKMKAVLEAPASEGDKKVTVKKIRGEEIRKLQDRVKRLLLANEHLCLLLRKAKITVPKKFMVTKFRPPKLWSNRITPARAKAILKQLGKENESDKLAPQSTTPRHRKAILNCSENKIIKPAKKKRLKARDRMRKKIVMLGAAPSNNCLIVLTQHTNSTRQVTVTRPSPLPALGPGTLILANGTIMPVLPPQPPPIILLPPPVTPTTLKSTAKVFTKIRPKFCSNTKTTQVNKVPIPALTSRYSNNNDLLTRSAKNSTDKATVTKSSDSATVPTVTTTDTDLKKQPQNTDTDSPVSDKQETVEVTKDITSDKVTTTESTATSETVTVTTPVTAPVTETVVTKATEVVAQTVTTVTKSPEPLADLNASELSNDIFATLQVPTGCQNPESTSPTAAFLMAFPLAVSSLTSVKVVADDDCINNESPPNLLQIGTMETTTKPSDSLTTPSILNFDNLSFFNGTSLTTGSNKEGFYNSNYSLFDSGGNVASGANESYGVTVTTASAVVTPVKDSDSNISRDLHGSQVDKKTNNQPKINYSNVSNKSDSNCLRTSNYIDATGQKQYNQCSVSDVKNSNVKTYPDPLYTNSNSYNYYNYSTDYATPSFNESYYNKNNNKSNEVSTNRSYYSLSTENYNDYSNRKSDNNNFNGNQYNMKCPSSNKNKTSSNKGPINWMTTPDYTSFNSNTYSNKEVDFYPTVTNNQSTNYFGNSSNQFYNSNTNNNNPVVNHNSNNNSSKKLNLPPIINSNYHHQRNDIVDEQQHQFSWSPTKIVPQFLDPTHHSFVSSTLPTLVGDLALSFTAGEQQSQKSEANRGKSVNNSNTNRRVKSSFESANFLSVSQLVDHNKSEPASRTATGRRNSGNRPNNSNSNTNKKQQTKVRGSSNTKVGDSNVANKVDVTKPHRAQQHKVASSYSNKHHTNYSAEALIGAPHLNPTNQDKAHINTNMIFNNKVNNSNSNMLPAPFLPPPENIISYFPPQQQDNSYNHQNHQNFVGPSTNFSANSFIPPPPPPVTTIMPSSITSNYLTVAHDSNNDYTDLFHNQTVTTSSKRNQQFIGNGTKKAKRKSGDNVGNHAPNFVDFSFLNPPPVVQQQQQQEDCSHSIPQSHSHPHHPSFSHHHHPNHLFNSCKVPSSMISGGNKSASEILPLAPPLGPVTVRSGIQHPEISPSINSGATSSLTNFNLSTIFPEINNKSAVPESYLGDSGRVNKSSNNRNNYTSTAQVSFADKPTFSFNYSATSQSYHN